MDIRTFEAFTMKDAVKAVKKSLGADAVILSTREKPGPSGKGTIFELTAAAAARSQAKSGAVSSLGEAHAPSQDSSPSPLLEAALARLNTLADQSPTKTQVQALEAGVAELKLFLVEALRGKDGSTLADLPPPLVPLERQLRVMGVDDASIADLLKHLRNLPTPEVARAAEGAESYYKDHAIRWMMKRLKIAPRWSVMSGAVSWQVVVGTSGVGKSSLVAKLAAHYAKREKVKVKVLSLDQLRLAAGEQMRIFCKIIGVPFAVISDVDELKEAAASHRDTELMLVDTAGVSAKNLEALSQLATLRESGLPLDFHLCLSVTEKETQMNQAVRAFSRLGLQSLAFTKLDESWSYGEIYNLSRRWELPLSFFATGPQIPEDLERASRERVVERIFGL